TGLGNDGIVPGLDVAVGNADVMTAIGIDAVGVAVEDHDAVNGHIVCSEQTDAVVRGVENRDAADGHELTSLQSNRFGSAAFLSVSVDRSRSGNRNSFHVLGPDKRVVEKACLLVGSVLETQDFVGIEIGLVRAGPQSCRMVQVQVNTLFQMQATAEESARREKDCSAAMLMTGVDGGLNGVRVLGLAVPLGAVDHDVKVVCAGSAPTQLWSTHEKTEFQKYGGAHGPAFPLEEPEGSRRGSLLALDFQQHRSGRVFSPFALVPSQHHEGVRSRLHPRLGIDGERARAILLRDEDAVETNVEDMYSVRQPSNIERNPSFESLTTINFGSQEYLMARLNRDLGLLGACGNFAWPGHFGETASNGANYLSTIDRRPSDHLDRRSVCRHFGSDVGPEREGGAILASRNARVRRAETGRQILELDVDRAFKTIEPFSGDRDGDRTPLPYGGRCRVEAHLEARSRGTNGQPVGIIAAALSARIADADLIFTRIWRVEEETRILAIAGAAVVI